MNFYKLTSTLTSFYLEMNKKKLSGKSQGVKLTTSGTSHQGYKRSTRDCTRRVVDDPLDSSVASRSVDADVTPS